MIGREGDWERGRLGEREIKVNTEHETRNAKRETQNAKRETTEQQKLC